MKKEVVLKLTLNEYKNRQYSVGGAYEMISLIVDRIPAYIDEILMPH